MLPKWFKEYLVFHRQERVAIIVLFVVLLLVVGWGIAEQYRWKTERKEILIEWGDRIVTFQEKRETQRDTRRKKQDRNHQKFRGELFPFDPNSLDSAGWVKLGFSPKQASTIINYRNAGAEFRQTKDLKKLFVVDEGRYKQLEPFVRIDTTSFAPAEEATAHKSKKANSRERYVRPKLNVNLNTADTTELQELYGIGPSFAKRITGYRKLLGGYIDKQQLLEVYGMDSSRFAGIMEEVTVNSDVPKRIDLNKTIIDSLGRHPYIGWKLARVIIRYRDQHGPFRNVDELTKIHIIDEEFLEKAKPYLCVNCINR